MSWLDRVAGALSRAGVYASLLMLFLMLGHIVLEIVLRSFFDSSTLVLEEFVGYGLAGVLFLALGQTLRDGAFIRLDLVLAHSGRALRRLLEALSVGATLALMLFLAHYLQRSVLRNWSRSATSVTVAEVPLWIPEGIALLGLGIFILQLAVYFVGILSGRPLIKQTHAGD